MQYHKLNKPHIYKKMSYYNIIVCTEVGICPWTKDRRTLHPSWSTVDPRVES
jgi:hypothetical protein